MKRIPVYMDCDPGTDDALAILMMAAAPNIRLKGLTTVAGNLHIGRTTGNALKIVDAFGLNIPVSEGSYPLMKKFEPAEEWINGATGLGDAVLPETRLKPTGKSAVSALYEAAVEEKGNLHILATGPLTNIALLLITYPGVKNLISHITFMGGACFGGNATPCAEFNIYTDPDAARIVFHSGVPLTMVGLDACLKTPIYEEELMRLHGRAGDFIRGLMGYPSKEDKSYPAEGIVMFDALSAAAVIEPEIVECRHLFIDVETQGEYTTGKTLVDVDNLWKNKPNAMVAFGSNRRRFVEILQETVRYYDDQK